MEEKMDLLTKLLGSKKAAFVTDVYETLDEASDIWDELYHSNKLTNMELAQACTILFDNRRSA